MPDSVNRRETKSHIPVAQIHAGSRICRVRRASPGPPKLTNSSVPRQIQPLNKPDLRAWALLVFEPIGLATSLLR